MALLDFCCDTCGLVKRNEFFMGDAPRTKTCDCGQPMEILWQGRSASVGFARPWEFTDDDGTEYKFSSPEAAHRFERRTEEEYKAGVRKRPFVFRELSQDRSNFDRNVFQDLRPQVPRERLLTRRRGKPIITSRTTEVQIPVDEEEYNG
jgi:hypothetical protein